MSIIKSHNIALYSTTDDCDIYMRPLLWREHCHDMEIPLSYAAIIARFGGLDGRRDVIILTDNAMLKTAKLIKDTSSDFVKSFDIINIDEAYDIRMIYTLTSEDLLILHIGIESWMGKHRHMAHAFSKPNDVIAKYICIRPTITAEALLEGLNTPYEVIDDVLTQYGDLQSEKLIRVTSTFGTDISLVLTDHWTIPYNTHEPGANAYLPPAEVSYDVKLGSANGIIVADVTVGELRVRADLIDSYGLVDAPVSFHISSGEITDITGCEMAARLKTELWKLPENCRKIIELGFGLSQMTPSGIIGIDESIAGTCHFGFGSGSGNDAPIHLDVVMSKFSVE